jgi:hypothetical protein
MFICICQISCGVKRFGGNGFRFGNVPILNRNKFSFVFILQELIRMVMQAEIIIARNISLQSKFTSELLERPDAKEELEHFVATILQNSEVPVRGGPMGPAGNIISKLFQAAQRVSCGICLILS